jgi:hypothetical protein
LGVDTVRAAVTTSLALIVEAPIDIVTDPFFVLGKSMAALTGVSCLRRFDVNAHSFTVTGASFAWTGSTWVLAGLVLCTSFLVFAAAAFECTVHATDVVTRGFVSLIANIIALFTAIPRALGFGILYRQAFVTSHLGAGTALELGVSTANMVT